MLYVAFIDSPIGVLKITGTEKELHSIDFMEGDFAVSHEIPQPLCETVRQLKEYFQGNRKDFDLVLSPKGTEFQLKVWEKLREIPFGQTRTYKEIAGLLGDEKVIRAAASANGKNPIPIVIPCHRVIGSDQQLRGYSGGLFRKEWLLRHEDSLSQLKIF